MEGNIEDWRKAGKIASEAREYSKTIIRPGMKLLDLSRMIDAKIKELGGEIAFPVNLSLNEFAAHQVPIANDTIILKDQLLKVDIGVHVNGCVGDTAYTFDLSGKQGKLVDASKAALENVMKILRPGITLGEIGKTVITTINSHGFQPIKNLSGHGLAPYVVHSRPTIPNYDTGDKTTLDKGMVFAIEPFATDGQGMIQESGAAEIFSQIGERMPRTESARVILRHIQRYKNLPFAKRWLVEELNMPAFKLTFGLRELSLLGDLHEYPPLVEVRKGLVSQYEHTFYIGDTVEVLTK